MLGLCWSLAHCLVLAASNHKRVLANYYTVPENKCNSVYHGCSQACKSKFLPVTYITNSMLISCRVQEICSHKTNDAYRIMKTFTSRTHSSNCNGDVIILEYIFGSRNLCCTNNTSFMSIEGRFKRYSHTCLPVYTKIMKNGWFHNLTAPYLIMMSQYCYTSLKTSIFAASNGTSLMSIGRRIQEI